MKIVFDGKSLSLIQGDITKQNVDIIVNAANSDLMHGGGVAAAIARVAGDELVRESRIHPYVPTGQVGITTAGSLNAKYVIHAVGPIWKDGKQGEEFLLSSAIKNSITKADQLKMQSIVFPAISTGIYGYPLQEAARVIINSIRKELVKTESVSDVRIVLFSAKDFDEFKQQLDILDI